MDVTSIWLFVNNLYCQSPFCWIFDAGLPGNEDFVIFRPHYETLKVEDLS